MVDITELSTEQFITIDIFYHVAYSMVHGLCSSMEQRCSMEG